jgi:hypothetical protein
MSDSTGDNLVEHVAGVDDFELDEATYRAAVARWPAARITLRQGIRVGHDTGQQLALAPPALRKGGHGGFACFGIPVRRSAILVMSKR